MKIKIAICLSGEPRLSHKAIHSINNIRDTWSNDIDIDIFYHLWDNITKRQKQINEDPVIEKTNKNYLNDMLKPTVGLIENKDVL